MGQHVASLPRIQPRMPQEPKTLQGHAVVDVQGCGACGVYSGAPVCGYGSQCCLWSKYERLQLKPSLAWRFLQPVTIYYPLTLFIHVIFIQLFCLKINFLEVDCYNCVHIIIFICVCVCTYMYLVVHIYVCIWKIIIFITNIDILWCLSVTTGLRSAPDSLHTNKCWDNLLLPEVTPCTLFYTHRDWGFHLVTVPSRVASSLLQWRWIALFIAQTWEGLFESQAGAHATISLIHVTDVNWRRANGHVAHGTERMK